jgi:hypothetical protein
MQALPIGVVLLFGAAAPASRASAQLSEPLSIGETFTMRSDILGETRRINVYRPSWVADSVHLPVLYMLDGGIGEDFLHVAGLIQVSTGNGTMRPVLLVGIENTERRRDLTGPTQVAEDREIAPRVGGSADFRRFLRSELMPTIRRRYATMSESGIVGESLAGLFVLETLLLEPDLFGTYIAFDPSLWWNEGKLLVTADEIGGSLKSQVVYLASSSQPEIAELTARFARLLASNAQLTAHHTTLPEETHATIYHPAALRAFRVVFRPRTN